ncbi:unnamed protein product [Hymenolepis diminuta]|uniref:Uncharacterized protein n=1 Tax=Hymenolepis diminuta TaxID=6216 RepID=A0A564XXQ7_HYMDI|nr:unnamed protein product [Hymenolepis diminuta]
MDNHTLMGVEDLLKYTQRIFHPVLSSEKDECNQLQKDWSFVVTALEGDSKVNDVEKIARIVKSDCQVTRLGLADKVPYFLVEKDADQKNSTRHNFTVDCNLQICLSIYRYNVTRNVSESINDNNQANSLNRGTIKTNICSQQILPNRMRNQEFIASRGSWILSNVSVIQNSSFLKEFDEFSCSETVQVMEEIFEQNFSSRTALTTSNLRAVHMSSFRLYTSSEVLVTTKSLPVKTNGRKLQREAARNDQRSYDGGSHA